ncbi:ribbon-helix-helix domain-containing protein [Sediminicoccus sp. BL-A-41-H5]|uniref:ribbon-helix-helix domain-containing protein n=1 Tax=Sediminicoccus sp. BL-A-41-H5 TaxID=3421106 RepID=UPI003D67B170
MRTPIPLAQAQAAEIERLLDSGACADPSEVVDAGLKALAAEMDDWLRREVLPVAQAMERDPSRAMSAEQAFAELRAHHQRRLREG